MQVILELGIVTFKCLSVKSILSDCNLYSITNCSHTYNKLHFTWKLKEPHLYKRMLILICSGTNDCDLNELSLTLQNITNFIKNSNHTNIILMNVPFQYDLSNSISVSRNISILNRKLQKLVKVFPHASFLETDNNRNLFTNHWLHLNELGKQLVNHQIASLLLTTFEQKTSSPITLGWHET